MSLELFQRLPKESARAYSAFKKFLDLGDERSLKKVLAEVEVNETRIKVWSSKFNWKERANAWEDYLSLAEQVRAKKIREKSAEQRALRFADLQEREYQAALKLLEKALEIIDLPVTEKVIEEIDEATGIATVTIIKPKAGIRDASAALKTYSELSRLSLGVETSREKVEVEVTTVTRVEQANKALKDLRQEIIDTMAKGLSLEEKKKLMQELAEVIAEEYKVNPKELTGIEESTSKDETIIEATFVEGDDIPEEAGVFWRDH